MISVSVEEIIKLSVVLTKHFHNLLRVFTTRFSVILKRVLVEFFRSQHKFPKIHKQSFDCRYFAKSIQTSSLIASHLC